MRKTMPRVVLQESERGTLRRIAEIGNRYEVVRARLLLQAGENGDVSDIAAHAGLSYRRARYWLRKFNAVRLDVFSARLLLRAAQQDDTAEVSSKALVEAPAKAIVEVETDAPPPEKHPPEVLPIPGVDVPRRKLRMKKSPGVEPGDPMSEAGRKVMFYQFERMLYHEPDTRLGEDIEALHDMRVATRRMRAAFQVFDNFYKSKAIKPHFKGLRATGRALGAVRDLDVFMEKIGCYRDGLPEAERGGVAPLLDTWAERRAHERARMIRYLDGPRYETFVDAFAGFLTTKGAGARDLQSYGPPHGYLVRHVAPHLVYARLEAVRSYEAVLDSAPIETLHALRIEFKRFRYTLEFFQEVLGQEGKLVVKEVKAMQDHLGDLNDAEVAGHILQNFIGSYEQSQASLQISARRSIDKVIQYMAYQAAEKHRLMVTFPEAWANFNRDEVRRALALAVSAL